MKTQTVTPKPKRPRKAATAKATNPPGTSAFYVKAITWQGRLALASVLIRAAGSVLIRGRALV
jgi:hypothetical protein